MCAFMRIDKQGKYQHNNRKNKVVMCTGSMCKCIDIYEIRFRSYSAVESLPQKKAGNEAPQFQSQLIGQSFGRVNVSIWQVM